MTGGIRSRIQSHHHYRWLVLVTVGFGMIMSILNSSIVNVALPTIADDFSSTVSTITWVLIVFTITQATLMPVSGRAGDIYGQKKVFIAGVVIFAVNSLLCTLAWSPHALIVGRGLQAIGTSAIAPMSLALIFNTFPVRERAQALGILGGVNGIAPTLGLLLGGFLVAAFGWRSVFLISIPMSLLIIPLAVLVLKESEPAGEGRGFDIVGALLLTTALFGGLLALNQGDSWGWGSPLTLGSFAAMALLLILFVAWERKVENPMLDLGLFRLRSLVTANIGGFFSSGAMFGALFVLPFYFQWVLDMSPRSFGMLMAPVAFMFFLVSPIGGRLTMRVGSRTIALTGLLIAGASYLIISQVVAVDRSIIFFLMPMSLLGVGLGLTMAPLTTTAIHDAPRDKRGIASSLPQMSRFVGASFVIALISSFYSWRVTRHLLELGAPAESVPAEGFAAADVDGVATDIVKEAFTASFRDVFLFTLIFLILAIIAVIFMPQLKDRGDKAGRPAAEAGRET